MKFLSPTSRLTRDGRARRRYNCDKQEDWDERAQAAVALLAEHLDRFGPASGRLAVADFGAGNERLRLLLGSHLDRDLDYHPYDLHPQLPTTSHLDVAHEMPSRNFDLVICLGLLEYLPSVSDFAAALKGVCSFALVSYVTSDSSAAMPYEERLRHGWTTHLKAEEVETTFEEAGFESLGRGKAEGTITSLWLWAATDELDTSRHAPLSESRRGADAVNDSMAAVRAGVTQQLGEPDSVDTCFDATELVRFSPHLPEKLSPEERERLVARARELEPWLQGPFLLGGDLVVGGVWRIDSRWTTLGDHIPDLTGKRVLDVGSNAGYDPFMFNLRGAEEILACEPFEFIEQARFLESLYLAGVNFQKIGWQELDPKEHGKFDLVHCHGVLYHEVDPLALLRRLHAMTAPGGTLLLGSMMLADATLADLFRFVPRSYFRDATWWWVPGSVALREMIESVGFEVENLFGQSPGPEGEFATINGYFRANRAH